MRIADRSELAAAMTSERDASAALVRADILVLLRERRDEEPPQISVNFSTDDAPPPDTARSTGTPPPIVETENDRRYKAAFSLGTAAFIQRRFADAVAAFRSCEELRPGDKGAQVMLR